jgi:hypothetical protein
MDMLEVRRNCIQPWPRDDGAIEQAMTSDRCVICGCKSPPWPEPGWQCTACANDPKIINADRAAAGAELLLQHPRTSPGVVVLMRDTIIDAIEPNTTYRLNGYRLGIRGMINVADLSKVIP